MHPNLIALWSGLTLVVGIVALVMFLNQAPQLDFPLFKGTQNKPGLHTLPPWGTLCTTLEVDVFFANSG